MKPLSPFVIVIPLIAAAILTGGVLIWRAESPSARTVKEDARTVVPPAAPSVPALTESVGKPTVGFGSLQSANPVADMRMAFDGLSSDGGAASISALESMAASL